MPPPISSVSQGTSPSAHLRTHWEAGTHQILIVAFSTRQKSAWLISDHPPSAIYFSPACISISQFILLLLFQHSDRSGNQCCPSNSQGSPAWSNWDADKDGFSLIRHPRSMHQRPKVTFFCETQEVDGLLSAPHHHPWMTNYLTNNKNDKHYVYSL